MTRCKGREFARRLEIAGIEVVVVIVEELHKRIGISFSVASGICGIGPSSGSQERWVLNQDFIRLVAPSNPQRIRIFGIPSQRTLGSVDLKMEFALAARTYLRNGENAFRAVVQMYQHRSVVVGFDRHL